MGLFELAHEGTLFLDEISEISLSLQSKLLRVLQEREVRRVGDTKVISVNVRIISATNKNIARLAKEGLFRSDLMYRLDVLRLFLPPLRERGRDAEVVFAHLLARLGSASGRGCPASRRTRSSRSARTPSRATSASCATSSNAPPSCARTD